MLELKNIQVLVSCELKVYSNIPDHATGSDIRQERHIRIRITHMNRHRTSHCRIGELNTDVDVENIVLVGLN